MGASSIGTVSTKRMSPFSARSERLSVKARVGSKPYSSRKPIKRQHTLVVSKPQADHSREQTVTPAALRLNQRRLESRYGHYQLASSFWKQQEAPTYDL